MEEIQTGNQQGPPEWALKPVTAWVYLAVSIALVFTPVYFLGFILAIVAAIFAYQERKANNRPAFWWTAAIVLFGALAYVFFIYQRSRGPAEGIPPRPPAGIAAPAVPADWYPDPKGEKRLRYWNGTAWTDHTAD
jgi:hypothetical protein